MGKDDARITPERREEIRQQIAHMNEVQTAAFLPFILAVELLIAKGYISEEEIHNAQQDLSVKRYKELPNGQKVYEGEAGYSNLNSDPKTDP